MTLSPSISSFSEEVCAFDGFDGRQQFGDGLIDGVELTVAGRPVRSPRKGYVHF